MRRVGRRRNIDQISQTIPGQVCFFINSDQGNHRLWGNSPRVFTVATPKQVLEVKKGEMGREKGGDFIAPKTPRSRKDTDAKVKLRLAK